MIEIVPYLPSHAALIELQPAQRLAAGLVTPDYARRLADEGPAVTVMVDRQPHGCMGLAWQWPGRGIVWALLSAGLGPNGLTALSLRAARWLDRHDWQRVEAYIDPDHTNGHRWARLFGFRHEGRLRRYAPDGRDIDLYAIVRGGPG